MEKKIFRSILFALIAVLTLFGLTLPMATPVRADDPSIWTDKADYTLGETVTISGSGFVAKTEVTVTVQRPDQTPETADIVSPPVISDEAGSFTCTYQLDGIEGTCLVTATDGINTVTTFIDVTQIYIEATQVDGVYTSDSGGTLDSTFDTSDDVWAVIDGGGSGDPISVRIYVIAFTSYSNGDTLTDLSSDGYETKSITNSDVNGPYKIWPANTSAGTYYVYVNKNLNGQYHSNERKYSFTISAADTIAPIVDIAVSDTLINEADDGGTFDVIATFSEAMDTTATPTISFDGDVETSGTLTFASDAWSEGDTVYTATYDVADVDEEVADVDVSVGGAKDVAGNFQDPDPTTKVDLFDVDTIAPSVTIEQAGGQADPTNASPIDFKVVFSESVADFATGDVALDGTAGADTAAVTGSGTDYDVAVSGMTTDGTVIASIADGVAHDVAGNANTASTSDDNTVTYAISQVGDLTIFKYNDANASGSYDVGDSPLANWQFTVSGVPGTFATGASGLVTVPDLTPGPYTVTENLKSGWQCTDPGASLKKVVAVTSGETTNVLFGNYLPTGDLIIYKYNDEEGDGEYNGDEPLLDGWKFNINGPIDLTGITSGGYVVFGNVPIGQYWVMETLQDGWCNTDPRGPWYGKLLQVNENQTTHVYFGNQQTGSIRIFKYNDLLGDGQFNGADFGLHGWHFRVSGRLVNFITDADGYVTVTNLVPGLHTVSEVLPIPPYWICTDPGLSRQKEVLVEPNATVYVMFGNHEGEHLVPILGDWGIVALSTAFVSLLAWFGMRKRRTAQRQ